MATSAYRTAVINDTPVFYAPLDEAFLPTDKKSGAILEAVNGPTAATAFDSGYTFNGTDECLLAPATDLSQVAGWVGATGEFSLELWFRQNNGWTVPDNVRYAVRWGGYGIFLRFYGFGVGDQTGYVIGGFYSPDAAERNVEEHGTWFNNAWHHVAVTFSRPTLRLYIDGNLVQTETRDFDVQITDTESDFIGIGRDGPFSSGFFPGTVDDVAIYNYELSEAQIDAHFVASRTETGGDDPTLDDPPGPTPRMPPEGIASSFHAPWDTLPGPEGGLMKEVSVDLTILNEPEVDDLYFWALQASFYDSSGPTILGSAHTGLQWNSSHPNNNAVNWGGYDESQVELPGSVSDFPSTPDNDNTRDFEWNVGQTYTFRIWIPETGEIAASIDGVEIRRLFLDGVDRLGDITMWSEVFAECSAPSVTVVWSGMTQIDINDVEYEEDSFLLNYQAPESYGCSNTNTTGAGLTVRQTTNTTRTNADDFLLVLSASEPSDNPLGVGYIPIV